MPVALTRVACRSLSTISETITRMKLAKNIMFQPAFGLKHKLKVAETKYKLAKPAISWIR
jgi:hypothetical protein